MSVLREAFTFVVGEQTDDDIRWFMTYVSPLSHDGVPGHNLFLPLRGVSTTTAYVRILTEMLRISEHPGGTNRISLKGLAEQLAYMPVIREKPSWAEERRALTLIRNLDSDAWRENLITFLLIVKRRRKSAKSLLIIDDKDPNVNLAEIARTISVLTGALIDPKLEPLDAIRKMVSVLSSNTAFVNVCSDYDKEKEGIR